MAISAWSAPPPSSPTSRSPRSGAARLVFATGPKRLLPRCDVVGRPGREAVTRRLQLRELEVAQLAANGMTDRDIVDTRRRFVPSKRHWPRYRKADISAAGLAHCHRGGA
jgi:hypothetical protein